MPVRFMTIRPSDRSGYQRRQASSRPWAFALFVKSAHRTLPLEDFQLETPAAYAPDSNLVITVSGVNYFFGPFCWLTRRLSSNLSPVFRSTEFREHGNRKPLPTVVAAKVERLPVAFRVESGCRIHGFRRCALW